MEGDLIDLRDPDPAEYTGQQLHAGQHPQTAPSHPPPVSSSNNTVMKTDVEPPNLGNVFKQCKIAKEMLRSVNFTSFGDGTAFNTGTVTPVRIGNIDMCGDTEVTGTFHGGRICKGNKTVNECVSMSFDPKNLMCVGCSTVHRIGDKGPITVCFSDQNFVLFILDGAGGCIAIVRLDNATLSELVELSFEIFEKNPLDAGSVILYGTASHLFRVGVSVYAQEWVELTTRVGAK
jgi:hypothetical protein